MSDGIWAGWLPLSVLVWAVQMAVFHGFGFGFELCDRAGWLQNAKVRNTGRLRYSQILPRVLFNQVFLLLPAMMILQWLGLAFAGPEHMGVPRFLASLVILAIGHDVVQYFSHRFLLHRPRFLRPLNHRLHHSTGASQAISACYMSAADFFLEIVLPYLVPLVLIGGGGADLFFHCLVAGLGAFGGLYEHSGYDFAVPFQKTPFFAARPWLGGRIAMLLSSHAHAEHHRCYTVSFSDGFGSPGLCDTLLRTRWDRAESASGRMQTQSTF